MIENEYIQSIYDQSEKSDGEVEEAVGVTELF